MNMQKKLKPELRFEELSYLHINSFISKLVDETEEGKQLKEIKEKIKEIVIEYIKKYKISQEVYKAFINSERIALKLRTTYKLCFPKGTYDKIGESDIGVVIEESDNLPRIKEAYDWPWDTNNLGKIRKSDPSTAMILDKLMANYIITKEQLNKKIENLLPPNFRTFTLEDLQEYNEEWFDKYIEVAGLQFSQLYGDKPEKKPESVKERLEILRKKLEE